MTISQNTHLVARLIVKICRSFLGKFPHVHVSGKNAAACSNHNQLLLLPVDHAKEKELDSQS